MFYTGWALPAPTSMNVSALLSEMRHSDSASHTTSPCVMQLPLPEATAAATPLMQCTPSSVAEMDGRSGGSGDGAGCVLQLAPRAALSYREMEQQLQRRASGPSACLHVKSNFPLLAQTGVVLMECVVGRPSAPPPPTAATTATVRSAEEKAKAASSSSAVKHPLPALVIGVCGRQLPWYSLPGEASSSVGFYVAQRHVVKHGSDDRDEVVMPAETTTMRSGGGGRIVEGDVVGCLVDLVRHTLSFTVNRHVVNTQRLDPDVEDGSLYFAVGLARRPQHTTDVAVRFYSGAACLRDVAQGGSEGCAARLPSCFPLEPYVRSLALSLVHQCNPHGEGEDDASTAHSAGAAAAAVAASLSAGAASVSEGGSVGGAATAVQQAAQAREAVRDLRVAAVLRSYLCARGLARTLTVLDSELDALAPSQTRHYATVPIEKGGSGSGAMAAKGAASSVTERSHGRGSAEIRVRLSPPQETRAVWQAFAANMAELRRTVLSPQHDDDAASPAASPLSSLLLRRLLWSPSVIAAFAHLVHSSDGTSSLSPEVLERRNRLRAASSHHTPPSSSPYQWFTASVSPALLTLCLLTLRQDVRYLLHAHHAVEEVWRVLRHHLRTTTARACSAASETPHTSVRCGAEETSHREVSAFTAFFTQLMWDAHHVLPSAMAHAQHRREDVRSAHPSTGAATATAAAASPLPLPPQAVQVLSSLAGRESHLKNAPGNGAYSGGTSRDGGNSAAAHREVQHFLMCVGQSTAPPAPQPRTTTTAAATGSARVAGRAALRAPSPAPAASTPPPLEAAVRFLYGSAVLPAAAPCRSAQSRLLQTLCSLLSHTLGTLQQLEEVAQSSLRGTRGDGDDSSRPAASAGVSGVQASVNMLDRLLDTVLKEVRQLVWRRLAHALEEANTQLSDRLSLWHTAMKTAAPRRRILPISEWVMSRQGAAAVPGKASGGGRRGSPTPLCNEESTEEDGEGESTREKAATESLTASFSSFQAPEISEEGGEEEEEEEEDESSAAQPTHSEQGAASAASSSAPFHSASQGAGDTIRSYETATEALPSLRQVWRRVTARAALAPSRHLVTHLFVQELRDALAVAPHVAWRLRQGKSIVEAAAEEATSTGTAPVGARASGDGVRVKRPPSAEQEHGAANPSCASLDPSQPEVGEQWFTEELYLSSVYMKRVLKHLAGH